VLAAAAAAIVAAAGTAFTEPAGGAPTGFVVADIRYSLDLLDASRVNGVSFDLRPAPRVVRVRLVSSRPGWSACVISGAHATCALTPAAALAEIDVLDVAATG
jgi:hypothetical protein